MACRLKAARQTDERVDAVGGAGHAKIGPNIDLGIAVWLVEKSCSDGHNTARRVFIAEQGCDLNVCGKFLGKFVRERSAIKIFDVIARPLIVFDKVVLGH
jgi:hypothetical protein